jgi:hypothetical protein
MCVHTSITYMDHNNCYHNVNFMSAKTQTNYYWNLSLDRSWLCVCLNCDYHLWNKRLSSKEMCAYRKGCAYKRAIYSTAHFSRSISMQGRYSHCGYFDIIWGHDSCQKYKPVNQKFIFMSDSLHKVYMLTTRMHWRCAWLPTTDVNTIINVITLPNSCYTVLYWSRIHSLPLYYILLLASTCTSVLLLHTKHHLTFVQVCHCACKTSYYTWVQLYRDTARLPVVSFPAPNPRVGKGLVTLERFLDCTGAWLHANIMQSITCQSHVALIG